MDSKKDTETKKYARKENIFNIIGGLMTGIGVASFFAAFVVSVLTERVEAGIVLAYTGFGLNLISPVFYFIARYYKEKKSGVASPVSGIDGTSSSSPSSIVGDYFTKEEARKDHLYHWDGEETEESVYCTYCGAKNPKDANFCCKCGKKLHKDE
ncbi:MAG: hypothetical protein WCR16_02960 [Bacilli bacterium]